MNSSSYRTEMMQLMRLTGPLTMAFLVSMAISVTDIVMMGRLGRTELAAGAAASDFYSIIYYLLAGVAAAVAPVIAQARGAGDGAGVRQGFQQGLWVVLILGIPCGVVVWNAGEFLAWIGVDDAVSAEAVAYARMMAFALVPKTCAMVCHHFLCAHDRAKTLLKATAIALPCNVFGNYALMFGHFGAPEMGLAGAGLSSVFSSVLMFSIMFGSVLTDPNARRYQLAAGLHRTDLRGLLGLLRIGAPIGLLSLGEVGIFLMSTVVIGVFGASALAAHAVALRCAGIVYALPAGLSQAATVRVGLFAGAGDDTGVRRSITTALLMAFLAGGLFLIVLLTFRHEIAVLFLGSGIDADLMALTVVFLSLLALYQPLSCLGIVSTGALRGLKDVHGPMVISIVSFWVIGGISGIALTQILDTASLGVWLGLATGAVSFGLLMFVRLVRTGILRGVLRACERTLPASRRTIPQP